MKKVNKGKAKLSGDKLTLEEIQAEYHKSDVCMGELLASYLPGD